VRRGRAGPASRATPYTAAQPEAVTLRAFADRLLDGQGREPAVVVLGDLNDEPTAATTQILLGPPG
jgi:endonuclease/exonuclease/phosphatase family metal-dependent hydrolase